MQNKYLSLLLIVATASSLQSSTYNNSGLTRTQLYDNSTPAQAEARAFGSSLLVAGALCQVSEQINEQIEKITSGSFCNQILNSFSQDGQKFAQWKNLFGSPSSYGSNFQTFLSDSLLLQAQMVQGLTYGMATSIKQTSALLVNTLESLAAFVKEELEIVADDMSQQTSTALGEIMLTSLGQIQADINAAVKAVPTAFARITTTMVAHVNQIDPQLARSFPQLTVQMRSAIVQARGNISQALSELNNDFNEALGQYITKAAPKVTVNAVASKAATIAVRKSGTITK